MLQKLPYLLATREQKVHSGNTSPDNSFIVFFSGGLLIHKAAGVMSTKTTDSNLNQFSAFHYALQS